MSHPTSPDKKTPHQYDNKKGCLIMALLTFLSFAALLAAALFFGDFGQ